MERKLDKKSSLLKNLGKETAKKITEITVNRLTRVGGWASAGGKRALTDTIKGIVQKST